MKKKDEISRNKSRKSIRAKLEIFRGNGSLIAGLCITLPLFIAGYIGPLIVPPKGLSMLSCPKDRPPSPQHILGTDTLGRDVFVLLVYSLRESLTIGVIAGLIGVAIGTIIGFIAGYKGGLIDDILRNITDLFLIIPTWPLLVLLSAYLKEVTIPMLATLLAVFSWAGCARGMRSQILSLKERGFVRLAKISGESDFEIIFKEILPNMLSYVGVMFGGSMCGAMMAEVGLEIIGLGPVGANTLGLMIYWATFYGALVKRMWWWIVPPVVCLVASFLGLQLLNIGLDRLYNPRLRR